MSTATRPTAAPARDPQVYHPLDRLRGIIRRYVVIEGVITACLLVAVWFCLGLVLDFGLFKVAGWDWVQDGAKGVRVVALLAAVALFGAFLVFRVVRRLTKEFSYPALALVLERKFPQVLGDRLITAVEMADVEAMGKFGYSRDMLHATIAEARERVGKVPVGEVFNWRRLWVMGFVAVGLLLGTLLLAFASHAVATKAVSPHRFGWKFAHVTGIFLERNVALMDTPWPRRAHVELVGFPEGEATVSRDVAQVPVTARAYKWVIADRGAPEGWRPMKWADVTEGLVGRKVPEFEFDALRRPDEPAGSLPGTAAEWTVDAVERRAAVPDDESDDAVSPETAAYRKGLRAALGDRFAELQEVFRALNAKADQPSMGRTLRKLELTRWVNRTDENGNRVRVEEPLKLEFAYRGVKYKGSGDLKGPNQNSEYSGDVSGLREDVNFSVVADDFRTSPRRIRLIPPPALKRLYRVQGEPAYLHHAPPQGASFDELKGKRQLMAEKNLALTGERSVFSVPARTEVTIVAEAATDDGGTLSDNDRIVSAVAVPVSGRFPGMVLDEKGAATQTPVPLEITEDGRGFRIEFKDRSADAPAGDAARRRALDLRLENNVEFKVTYTNKYGVATTRAILIQVAQDQPPVVEFGVDVIRKMGNEYLVTPLVRIPFNPDSFVKDDHGLSKVVYQFDYQQMDSDVVRAARISYLTRALLDVPLAGHPGGRLFPFAHLDNFNQIGKGSTASEPSEVFVGQFDGQLKKQPRDPKDELLAKLARPLADGSNPGAITKIELNKSDDYFDLKELNDKGLLKILAAPGEVQPTYRMNLFLKATDTNADHEAGPRVTRSAEPIRLRIVSEGDLLTEIGKEIVTLGTRLDEALTKLAAAKRKYEFVRTSNGYKEEVPEQVDAVKVRGLDALQDVDKARDIVATVLRECRRIHRECEVNRLNDNAIREHLGYCLSLEAILSEDPQALVAFPKTQGFLNNVQGVLNNGRWAPLNAVSDAEQSLYALERNLMEIRRKFGESESKEALIKTLKTLLEQQAKVGTVIAKLQEAWLIEQLNPAPTISSVGAVALTKGESKKISHPINWAKYKEDDLAVKVTVSDPAALTVPAELMVNYEKNQFRFEYDVKAGMKEGTYKVTLTPAVGKPVETVVVVK